MGKIVGAWHWVVLLTRGRRCWACHRRYFLHWPWALAACNRAPLSIVYDHEREQAA